MALSISNYMNWHIRLIDMFFKNFDNEVAFLRIWNQEKTQLFPDNQYLLTYPEEYLAEAFAYYYIGGSYRNELRVKAPLTYQYIKNIR